MNVLPEYLNFFIPRINYFFSGNYNTEGKKLLNATDWKNFGTLYHPTPKSFYNKMFNLVEDVDEDDLSLGTDFMDNFKNKIKKIAAIAKKVL